jgi:hypothetical protein
MANESFQGKLLSVYETRTGLTDAPETRREEENEKLAAPGFQDHIEESGR